MKEPSLETIHKMRELDGNVEMAQNETPSFECMAEYIPLDQEIISKEDPKS